MQILNIYLVITRDKDLIPNCDDKGFVMLTKKELPHNPAVVALWLLGNKWTLYILQRLFVRPHSFGELRRSIDGISDKVLSDNLKRLQSNEIVCKSITSDNPPRSYYSLTPLGKSLLPVIDSLDKWGTLYIETTHDPNSPLN